MDYMEKAVIRKQIEDLSSLAKELKQDLKIVQNELAKIEGLLKKKKYNNNEQLQEFKKVYSDNKNELESTLKTAHGLIKQLKLEAKPRAHIQVTKKLV